MWKSYWTTTGPSLRWAKRCMERWRWRSPATSPSPRCKLESSACQRSNTQMRHLIRKSCWRHSTSSPNPVSNRGVIWWNAWYIRIFPTSRWNSCKLQCLRCLQISQLGRQCVYIVMIESSKPFESNVCACVLALPCSIAVACQVLSSGSHEIPFRFRLPDSR